MASRQLVPLFCLVSSLLAVSKDLASSALGGAWLNLSGAGVVFSTPDGKGCVPPEGLMSLLLARRRHLPIVVQAGVGCPLLPP